MSGIPRALMLFCLFIAVGCTGQAPTAPSFGAANNSITTSPKSPATTGTSEPSPTFTLRAADEARIRRGTVVTSWPLPSGSATGTATLDATHGLSLDLTRLRSSGVHPGSQCRFEPNCRPGEQGALVATWNGIDLDGTIRLQGKEVAVGGLNTPGVAGISLQTASFTWPAEGPTTTTLTVPFTMTGTVSTPDRSLTLTGEGTVTMDLVWRIVSPLGQAAWTVVGTRFEF